MGLEAYRGVGREASAVAYLAASFGPFQGVDPVAYQGVDREPQESLEKPVGIGQSWKALASPVRHSQPEQMLASHSAVSAHPLQGSEGLDHSHP